jgi:hypothetical protein
MAVEILIGVLVAVLAVATVAAAYLGLAGVVGVIRFGRCEHCGRLGVTRAEEHLLSCLNCRHERILHPILVLHRTWESHHVSERAA